MTVARSEVVIEGQEAVYHCVTRCVRAAFLCGVDPKTGVSREHRKGWIRSRIRELAAAFAVEVAAYAVMSNHFHVVVRTRPDWVESWSDEEAARRWLSVFGVDRNEAGANRPPSQDALMKVLGNPDRLMEIRQRLGSVSWFMRSLNEWIARTANQEDGRHGRFWSGRFNCQVLLDESAVLACMMYVDLNPVRAKVAHTPEQSEYTSVFERIHNRAGGPKAPWLCPINGDEASGRDGLLSLGLDDYLSLLDWTGRQFRPDKPGAIPADLADILDRLQINRTRWVGTVRGFGGLFHRVAGRMESIAGRAHRMGKRWLAGLGAGKVAFST
jgi:REP element-mobilizing transposase RayT